MTPVVVLDGAMGTELTARGHDLSDRLWSARVLLTDPGAVEDVHLAYFEAGATVATTASYQASIEGFAAAGLDRDAALALIRESVVLARRARDRADSALGPAERRIAGSVGPYGALLADGSEYRGDYELGVQALADFHRPRMEALLEAGADLLAIETIPSVREAEVLVGLVEELDATGVANVLVSRRCFDVRRRAHRDRRRARCRRTVRRSGRQLHGPTAHPGPPRAGRRRHGAPVDRLSERWRHVGRDRQALDQHGGRRVRSRGGRLVGWPRRHVARRLLRDGPG